MPDYAYQTSFIEDSSVATSNGALAIGTVATIELAHTILTVLNRLKNNKSSLSESADELGIELKEKLN